MHTNMHSVRHTSVESFVVGAQRINNCIIVLCVPCLMSSVHEQDCLREETVSVSGRSGAQSTVESTRR